jgi:AraC family ethanolamine operon transcriptional activator
VPFGVDTGNGPDFLYSAPMPGPRRSDDLSATPIPSKELAFRSYDQLVDAIQDASLGSCVILRREERPWRLRYDLTGSVLVQSGVDGAACIADIQVAKDRTGVLLVGPAAPSKFIDGREIGAETLCLLQPRSVVEVSTPAATTWLSVTAATEAVDREAALLSGNPLGPSPIPVVSFSSARANVDSLRTLLLGVANAIDSETRGLHPEAAANLERTLLRSLARYVLDAQPEQERRRPLRVERASAFRSIFEFLRTLPSEPVYVEDLCRATGLPERTLRLLFLEQFGESPVRVLRARRLCLVYEALRASGVGMKEIRPVAQSLGFWHMGQFSADYRALFGELPSDTVRRARQDGPNASKAPGGAGTPATPFLRAASR